MTTVINVKTRDGLTMSYAAKDHHPLTCRVLSLIGLWVRLLITPAMMFPVCTRAATFTPTWLAAMPQKALVIVQGSIEPGDTNRLLATMNYVEETRPGSRVVAIDLNTPGGNVVEGFSLGAVIQANGFDVVLYPGATCASACAVMFFSGGQKYLGLGARVGVHRASLGPKHSEDAETYQTSLRMTEKLRQLGASQTVLDKLLHTAPDGVAWLTVADLQGISGVVVSQRTPGMTTSGYKRGWEIGRSVANSRACPDQISEFADGCRAGAASVPDAKADVAQPRQSVASPHSTELLDRARQYSAGFVFGIARARVTCKGQADWVRGCEAGAGLRAVPGYDPRTKIASVQQLSQTWLDGYDGGFHAQGQLWCGHSSDPSDDGCRAGQDAWRQGQATR